jgi:hypothetical protein
MLSLSALTMPTTSYRFGHITFSGKQWDRQFAQSPYVHGRQLTSRAAAGVQIEVDLICIAELTDSVDTLDQAQATLLAAIEQFAYTVTVTATDGIGPAVTHTWAAEPADWDPDRVTSRWTSSSGTGCPRGRPRSPCTPCPKAGRW